MQDRRAGGASIGPMPVLLIIALIIFLIWIGAFGFFFSALGSAVHLLLVLAIILVIVHFVSSQRRV
jgi:Family of unknown function (DUF5670)